MVYLITGKKGAGKTTYAKRLVEEFRLEGHSAKWLDGDVFRKETGNDDYTSRGRWNNLLQAASAAQRYEREGNMVVLSFIMPLRSWRNQMRCYFEHSHIVYIPGGTLWKGTEYETPNVEELAGVIWGRKLIVDGLTTEVITHE